MASVNPKIGNTTYLSLYQKLGGKQAVEAAVEKFYERVMADKRINHFFKDADMNALRQMQVHFLTYAFGGSKKYSGKTLANAHAHLVKKGLNDAHYDAVVGHLASVLGDLGISQDLIEEVGTVAESVRDDVLGRKNIKVVSQESDGAESIQAMSAINGSATAVMMVDRDLVVTYVNPATMKLFKDNLRVFQEAYKGFDPNAIVGTCIDIFHKNPSHQRRILSDEKNLPWKADIKVGPLTFALNVCAMKDNNGRYVGNSLEWANVTEARRDADEATRIQSAIDGSATAVMMIDRDFNVTYVNASTMKLFKDNLRVFQGAYMGFDPDKIVGTCIDIFHKNPAHQRRILDDEKNLPWKANIQVGPLHFALSVSAMKDKSGKYIGNSLEWANVTEAKRLANETARMQSAMEGSATAVMMIDRDFNITYVNPASMKLFKDNLRIFKEAFKGFNPDTIIGTCIDIFHKNPAHQRKLLADVNNLPHTAEIKIGPLTVKLNVSAMLDSQGNYIGNSLEWSNITAERAAEESIAATIKEVDARTGELNRANVTMIALSGKMSTQVQQITAETSSAASGAEEMSNTMTSISAAAEQASANINSVAVSTEQMTNSVAEIANNTERAREVTQNAVRNVENASARVGELDSAAKEISQVIEAIVEIAEQTKLLALNATIEAARAGEAGKGFAVVANEVKELAKQTREATADIRKKIENMQSSTKSTVGEIGNINKVMNDVNEIVGIIATSVEEQNAATKDIASNISQASAGVKDVTSSVVQAATVSKDIAKNLNNVNDGIQDVAKSSADLNQSIDSVKTTSEGLSDVVTNLKQQQRAA
jgi:methyl-accepting chemotaxis protein